MAVTGSFRRIGKERLVLVALAALAVAFYTSMNNAFLRTVMAKNDHGKPFDTVNEELNVRKENPDIKSANGVSKIQSKTAKNKADSIKNYLSTQSAITVVKAGKGLPDNCDFPLGATPADDLAKIESYKFGGIQEYIEGLFSPEESDPEAPELPVFVTAWSSNHFNEGVAMVENFKEKVKKNYSKAKLIIFDIGLTPAQVVSISNTCSCEVKTFPFEKYPAHMRTLRSFSWKPVLIQMVARENPFVFWIDASIRFKTGNLDDLFTAVVSKGLFMLDAKYKNTGTGTISERTNNATFNFLHEHPCTYANQGEKAGGLIWLFANKLITKYFIRPWVACALTYGCMDPGVALGNIFNCPPNREPYKYHLCHRFDQSVAGILYTRLFHRNMSEHAIDFKYIMVCRSTIMSVKTCFMYGN